MELKQSAQEYEIPHQLAYYECNELGHPTLSMVMSMLMVVADKQSDQLGLSQENIQATGGTWVIVSFEGTLDLQSLKIGDTVILERGRPDIIVSLRPVSFGSVIRMVKKSMLMFNLYWHS